MSDCLIIGAGPYALSLAAHLRARRVDTRVLGRPMDAWATGMPEGMWLKSEGFASTLFDPQRAFTLETFCRERGIDYGRTGVPVSADTFAAYGRAFCERFVPDLERVHVRHVSRTRNGFRVVDEDGGVAFARRVVVATGLTHYAHVPDELAALPADRVSHSSAHHALDAFRDRDVVVVGAGASAMDYAGLLHRAGARSRVVTRRASVRFQTPLGTRSRRDRLRAPMTAIGPGWKSVLCTEAPLLFHAMPAAFRSEVVARYLGPAPAWFARDLVQSKVPIETGLTLTGARLDDGGRVVLELACADGGRRELAADHVIAATGFAVDVSRLGFLDGALAASVATERGAPRLSRDFESSVPGLHFIGAASANSFGPMLRFACGAGFTARRLSRFVARERPRRMDAPSFGPGLRAGSSNGAVDGNAVPQNA